MLMRWLGIWIAIGTLTHAAEKPPLSFLPEVPEAVSLNVQAESFYLQQRAIEQSV